MNRPKEKLKEIESSKYLGGPGTVYLDECEFDFLINRVKKLEAALSDCQCECYSSKCSRCKALEGDE